MQRITADSNIEDVMREIGVGSDEKLRESEKRRNYLEKYAQLKSRNPDVSLNIKNAETSFVAIDGEDGDEFLNITITSRGFDQTITDFPDEYHYYILQKAFTGHEVGHVLYSSYPAMKKYAEMVEDKESTQDTDGKTYRRMFENFFNALEDGAIEKFLAQDFRLDEELFYLRATLHEKSENYFGHKVEIGEKTEYHYPFFFAIMTAVMNIGVYDNGELRKLLDEDNNQHKMAINGGEYDLKQLQECIPKIQTAIENLQSEGDAEKRTEIAYELWNEIVPYIDQSTTPGKNEFKRNEDKKESNNYGAGGVPENISEGHSKQQKKPTAGSGSSETSDEDGDSQTLGQERGDKKVGEITDEAKKKAKEAIKNEASDGGGNLEDEIEEIIDSLGAGDGVDEIYIPDDGEVDRNRQLQSQRYGTRCARILRNRLRKQQKDKTLRGKKRGSFDERRIVQADRGSTRVFKQTQEGDNKDYSCIIVCDRSGSMGSKMEDVELAAGAVAYGLQEVGVDTSILDTYNSKTAIAKPFRTEVEDFKEKLFAGRVGGGTPLRHSLQFAKQRITRGEGEVPFMIVITDGRPANKHKVKEHIKEAQFPVIGIYLSNNDKSDQLSLYDRAITVSDNDDVMNNLLNVIQNIMF